EVHQRAAAVERDLVEEEPTVARGVTGGEVAVDGQAREAGRRRQRTGVLVGAGRQRRGNGRQRRLDARGLERERRAADGGRELHRGGIGVHRRDGRRRELLAVADRVAGLGVEERGGHRRAGRERLTGELDVAAGPAAAARREVVEERERRGARTGRTGRRE